MLIWIKICNSVWRSIRDLWEQRVWSRDSKRYSRVLYESRDHSPSSHRSRIELQTHIVFYCDFPEPASRYSATIIGVGTVLRLEGLLHYFSLHGHNTLASLLHIFHWCRYIAIFEFLLVIKHYSQPAFHSRTYEIKSREWALTRPLLRSRAELTI